MRRISHDAAMLNRLKIEVIASDDTRDHQARLLIDDVDWLDSQDAIGLDPPHLVRELAKLGSITVGRCNCGEIGCGSIGADIRRDGGRVEWRALDGTCFAFDAEQYDAEIARFLHDRSWETPGRRLEREIDAMLSGTMDADGYGFEWASTRIHEGLVHLSYRHGDQQRLESFPWDEHAIESALDEARRLRNRLSGG